MSVIARRLGRRASFSITRSAFAGTIMPYSVPGDTLATGLLYLKAPFFAEMQQFMYLIVYFYGVIKAHI